LKKWVFQGEQATKIAKPTFPLQSERPAEQSMMIGYLTSSRQAQM